VHLLSTLVFPPLLLGIISRVKAIAGGRRGPPLLQPYFDLLRLVRKGVVFSRATSWVFLAGPVAGLAATLAASLLVPLGAPRGPVSFEGDPILFASLLGLGRFFTVLAALDTGSSFEGMGASREATWAALAEPAVLLGLLAGVRLSSGFSLAALLDGGGLWTSAGAPLALVAVSFFVVLLAENSRIPFDDPSTHLELTMVHEVMVLDHSGPPLAFIQYGAAVKLFLFAALVVRLVLPNHGAWLDPLAFLGGVCLVGVAIGAVESTTARLQLPKVPRLLVSAVLLSAFGLILVAR
jgi:formate hydrogenlyase subunit 4